MVVALLLLVAPAVAQTSFLQKTIEKIESSTERPQLSEQDFFGIALEHGEDVAQKIKDSVAVAAKEWDARGIPQGPGSNGSDGPSAVDEIRMKQMRQHVAEKRTQEYVQRRGLRLAGTSDEPCVLDDVKTGGGIHMHECVALLVQGAYKKLKSRDETWKFADASNEDETMTSRGVREPDVEPPISEDDLQDLADAVAVAPTLRTVELTSTALTDATLAVVAEAATDAPQLRWLRIRGKQAFGAEGLTLLAAALRQRAELGKPLAELDLSGRASYAGDEAWAGAEVGAALGKLLDPRLKLGALVVRDVGFTEAGLSAFVGALKGTAVHSLDIGDNLFTLRGVRALGRALVDGGDGCGVEWLSLSDTPSINDVVGITLAEQLLNGSRLDGLDLSRTRIGEASGRALAAALNDSAITPLRHLHLNETFVGDKALVAMSKMLRANTHLQTLSLRKCRSFDALGAGYLCRGIRERQTRVWRDDIDVLETVFKYRSEVKQQFLTALTVNQRNNPGEAQRPPREERPLRKRERNAHNRPTHDEL